MSAPIDDDFELYDLRVEVVAPPGAKLYCGARARRLFRIAGRDADPAAGAGHVDLFARLGRPVPRRQAAPDPSAATG